MSDDTHVTDVGGLVHKGPNLVYIARERLVPWAMADVGRRVLAYGEVTGGGAHSSAPRRMKIARETVRTPWWLIFTGIMIQRRVKSGLCG